MVLRSRLLLTITIVAAAGSSCGGGGGSGNVVSCDIQQAGLHYCEEARGSTGSDTGCPQNMAGYTPGTGCSRTGVTGTCKSGVYEVFFYDPGIVAATVASVCPAGGFMPGAGGSGGTGGSSGQATCTDLARCCPMLATQQLKDACMNVLAMGDDSQCKSAYNFYVTDSLCH